MISNLQCAGVGIWGGRRLWWKVLPVATHLAAGQQLTVAHSGPPLAERPYTPQVDYYLHASTAHGNLESAALKVLKTIRPPWFQQGYPPSSSLIQAMEWPCPRCTFLNKGETLECELCDQPFMSGSSVLASDAAATGRDANASIQSQDFILEWNCTACTFLNYGKHRACQMCGETRDAVGEEPHLLSTSGAVSETHRPSMPNGVGEASAPNADVQESKLEMEGGGSTLVPQPDASQIAQVSDTVPIQKNEDMQAKNPRKRKTDASGSDYDGASNSLLKMLHDERMKRSANGGSLGKKDDVKTRDSLESPEQKREKGAMADGAAAQDLSRLVIMFYNVWFREDIEMYKRMAAIGKLIEDHQPHVICFQEVTLNIYNVFKESTWWKQYSCSVSPHLASTRAYFTMQLCRLSVAFHRRPFSNTAMGRELCLANLEVGSGKKKVVIATTHLESPCPAPPTWDQMFSKERVQQAVEALTSLSAHSNTIFGGDMNWNDKLDGAPPLPGGWSDAWLDLRPSEPGFTYDTKANPMLAGGRCLRSRLDRIFCHLKDFKVESIEMIGLQEIPGVTYEKEKKLKKQVKTLTLPVLPSDHFGLLLKIGQKDEST